MCLGRKEKCGVRGSFHSFTFSLLFPINIALEWSMHSFPFFLFTLHLELFCFHTMILDGSLKPFFVGLRPLMPSLLDEVFWEQLVGAKTLSILKLVMGNETLLVSGSVFLGRKYRAIGNRNGRFRSLPLWNIASFATYIKSVYYSIKNFIEYRLYVSIEVDDQEIIYRPIASFIAEQMENVDLRKAQGEHDVRQYDDDRDYYRRYTTRSSSNPSISLQPGK